MGVQIGQINEMVEEIRAYTAKLNKACESISELFYEPMTEQSWNIFRQLVEGLEGMYKSVHMTYMDMCSNDVYKKLQEAFCKTLTLLAQQFENLNRAIESLNYVEIGDIIKYELTDIFQELEISLHQELGA